MPATTSQQHKQQASTSTSAAAAASQPASLAKPQIASRVTSPDDGRRDRREPQLYVWVVTINRDVTNEEFQRYLSAVDPSLRRALEASLGAGPQLAARARGLGTLRKIVADLLPRMLMTRQRIPNAGWRFARNSAGKWYIDSPPTTSGRTVSKVMGFGLAERDSMIGMAFAQGYKQQVVNVGMDIVRIPDHVDNEEAETFIGSLMHKLAPEELSQIVPALPVEKKLSRLCIMLAVKEAYLKALGQPHGFDLSRIAVVINPGGRSTMSVDKQPVYGWEFRLFTTDIGVSPTVRAQQPAASSGSADVLDVRGRPTDPDPRSWRSANTGSSSRVMAGAGPSSSTTDDRVPPARLASLSSGRLMGGAGPTGYESAPPPTAQTALGRSISLARTSSAPITTSTSRHAPSSSASYPSSGYRPNLSSASSSVSSVSSSSISSAATTRAYTPSAASHHANGVRPGTVPARTGSMPSVLQHPSHVNGAGSGGGYSSGAQTRLFAGQGPSTSASTSTSTTSASGLKPYTVASSTSSSGPSHPRATALSSTSTSSLGSSRTAASSTTSLASTASSATTMASHSDEPRVVQERYQCATAMWRGWTDRTEVVFAERDRDEMTSWLQFLTVTALARSVGSGVRNDPAP